MAAGISAIAPDMAQAQDWRLRHSVFGQESVPSSSTAGEYGPRNIENVRARTLGIIAANTLGVALYGNNKWWQDGFRSRFSTDSEGWFGQHTYSGGADKLGHFFMNYASTRLFSRVFEWAGNDAEHARHTAAWMTLATMTAVEVLDGFSRKWRFSKEDAIVNFAGVGTALLLEHHRALDDVLDLRFLYQASRENGKGYDPFGDYSGQTYLLVLKASGVPEWRGHPFLRYLEFAAGYGTRGYTGSSPAGAAAGSRYVYVGISLNLSRILDDTVFKDSPGDLPLRQAAGTFLELVQVPGTVALERRRLGK